MNGMSLDQHQLELTGQIEKLRSHLWSDQHYNETPTLAYGTHDPLEVELSQCDSCSGEGVLDQSQAGRSKTRWQVRCSCCSKISGAPTRNPWTASLMWNGINLKSMQYFDLPLFGLADLNPREAHDRIKRIRANLELRISLSDAQLQLHNAGGCKRKPGTKYAVKLDAYLKWAMLAHRLIKLAMRRPCSRAKVPGPDFP